MWHVPFIRSYERKAKDITYWTPLEKALSETSDFRTKSELRKAQNFVEFLFLTINRSQKTGIQEWKQNDFHK